jgi:Fe-Mn family superoxide dismutase
MAENKLNRRDILSAAIPIAGAVSGFTLASGLLSENALFANQAGSTPNPVLASLMQSFKDGAYTLPPLPYAYDALEPSIDEATMKLHHDKHHLGYVNGLNATLKGLAEIREAKEPNANLLTGLQESLTFNGSGHVLHSIFWGVMAPKAGGEPGGAIAKAIAKDFGSVDAFRAQYSQVAGGVKGSGWAILAYEPLGDTLMILQVKQHDLQTVFGAVPLLPLDVWEHAYYLKYQNMRADYIKAWWNVVNWPAVDAFYTLVRKTHGKQG